MWAHMPNREVYMTKILAIINHSEFTEGWFDYGCQFGIAISYGEGNSRLRHGVRLACRRSQTELVEYVRRVAKVSLGWWMCKKYKYIPWYVPQPYE